eukprot:EG_transcript_12992
MLLLMTRFAMDCSAGRAKWGQHRLHERDAGERTLFWQQYSCQEASSSGHWGSDSPPTDAAPRGGPGPGSMAGSESPSGAGREPEWRSASPSSSYTTILLALPRISIGGNLRVMSWLNTALCMDGPIRMRVPTTLLSCSR